MGGFIVLPSVNGCQNLPAVSVHPDLASSTSQAKSFRKAVGKTPEQALKPGEEMKWKLNLFGKTMEVVLFKSNDPKEDPNIIFIVPSPK
jgi:hypothetical protein